MVELFISCANENEFINSLIQRLIESGIIIKLGKPKLNLGLFLYQATRAAISTANYFAVIFDAQSLSHARKIRSEINFARELANSQGQSFQPLILNFAANFNSEFWFESQDIPQILIKETSYPQEVDKFVPIVTDALRQFHNDPQSLTVINQKIAAVNELVLTFYNPNLIISDGRERLQAEASVCYYPAGYNLAAPTEDEQRFRFMAPLEPLNHHELIWYLANYHLWPVGEFQRRAQTIEATLLRWGQSLYRTALGAEAAHTAREAWRRANGVRRFSVCVNASGIKINNNQVKKLPRFNNQAWLASAFLSLPWELIHDGRDFLFQGSQPLAINKIAPTFHDEKSVTALDPPLRVMLICPRPINEHVVHQDHRHIAQPLIAALINLGGLAQFNILNPPTLEELEKTLLKAQRRRNPYTAIHFDGYAIYDQKTGRIHLGFEDANHLEDIETRREQLIDYEKLTTVLREQQVPLVFITLTVATRRDHQIILDDPKANAIVALRLLSTGINTVITLNRYISKNTSTKFLTSFYDELLHGKTIEEAMNQGRLAICNDPYRLKVIGTTQDLTLLDWFIPEFYQNTPTIQLFRHLSTTRLTTLREDNQPQLLISAIKNSPAHGFYGRSRELLALERRLLTTSYAVITGSSGIGKTTLALEAARWLVISRRFNRAVLVSLEDYPNPRAVLDRIGQQLINNWHDHAATMTDPQAQQRIESALNEQPTLMIIDKVAMYLTQLPQKNIALDSCLNAPSGFQMILDLVRSLQRNSLITRIIFTSYEPLPPPYTGHIHFIESLEENAAIAMLAGILNQSGLTPLATDSGRTQQELINLVQAVNCHPQALFLIAPELARHGVRAVTAKLRTIIAELQRLLINDKDYGIYAALILSLRAISFKSQSFIQVFVYFQGVASLDTITTILNITPEETAIFVEECINAGLLNNLNDGCIAIHPLLPRYLKLVMDEQTQQENWRNWATAMVNRLNSLYKEWFRNTNLSLRLTRYELPNLLNLLDWTAAYRPADEVLGLVWRLETLLASLRLPRVLERVTALRERLAPRFAGWGRAAFTAEAEAVERLLNSGWLPEALEQAQTLVARFENAGDKGYPGAAYDQGLAQRLLGRTLEASGSPAPALAYLELARRRFQALADGGSVAAARMASVCCTERGDFLRAQGQLEAAAAAYQEALVADEARGARRDAAINRLQLADIWRLQGAHPEALSLYVKARESFTELRELSMVAVAWHQMGLIYQELGDWQAAEAAYTEVLNIWVRRNDLTGEAMTLIELADLYIAQHQLEQAISCYRQAAERYATLNNNLQEGQARYHLANTLLSTGDLNSARQEVERALICQASQSNSTEPWKLWGLLFEIERQQHHPEAALRARDEASISYLAYRREGGEPLSASGRLCEQVAMIMAQGARAMALLERLRTVVQSNLRSELKDILPRLLAIIAGSRDPNLANDPNLNYSDSAELHLLLERCNKN